VLLEGEVLLIERGFGMGLKSKAERVAWRKALVMIIRARSRREVEFIEELFWVMVVMRRETDVIWGLWRDEGGEG
jgi:hypothetical protein